jgi:hypothetical protein
MADSSDETVKRPLALSRDRCAYSKCTALVVHPNRAVTGEIGHIRAQSADGPRFNPAQTEKDRHASKNSTLLTAY